MPEFSTSVVLAACLVAAATDLYCYRIHNLLTLPLLFSGLGYCLLLSGWWGLATSSSGAAVGFAALFGLYLAGGMGAGDVKLMAGMGAWLGPTMISHVVLASCAIGGLYGLGLIAWNRLGPAPYGAAFESNDRSLWGPRPAAEELTQVALGPARRRQLIPFGFVIFVGLLASLAPPYANL